MTIKSKKYEMFNTWGIKKGDGRSKMKVEQPHPLEGVS